MSLCYCTDWCSFVSVTDARSMCWLCGLPAEISIFIVIGSDDYDDYDDSEKGHQGIDDALSAKC